jgi:hypothetical protein
VILVVNMIPVALSGETNQDSEPNLAVNPTNPQHIAGSAFTPNPAGAGNAPIFTSTDGGLTWNLVNSVPSQSGLATGDITLRFSDITSNLYAGILRRPGNLRLNILRTANFQAAAAMTVLVDRNQVDQPYVGTRTTPGVGHGQDRVYVGRRAGGAPRSTSISTPPRRRRPRRRVALSRRGSSAGRRRGRTVRRSAPRSIPTGRSTGRSTAGPVSSVASPRWT